MIARIFKVVSFCLTLIAALTGLLILAAILLAFSAEPERKARRPPPWISPPQFDEAVIAVPTARDTGFVPAPRPI